MLLVCDTTTYPMRKIYSHRALMVVFIIVNKSHINSEITATVQPGPISSSDLYFTTINTCLFTFLLQDYLVKTCYCDFSYADSY